MLPYSDNKTLTVINLLGGPGVGKSTSAAGLFYLMKRDYFKVELVTETAKDMVWEDRVTMLTEQDYIFAKQNNRLRRLVGKVEYAVTDCPLLLSVFYTPWDFPPHFKAFAEDVFRSYDNINIFLNRKKEFVQAGRVHTEEQSNLISSDIKGLLDLLHLPYHVVDADEHAPEKILEIIKNKT